MLQEKLTGDRSDPDAEYFVRTNRWKPFAPLAAAGLGAWLPPPAKADEGGVSFWLPGQFGSLTAAPASPGWSVGSVFYHTSADAAGNVATVRLATIGGFSGTITARLDASLDANVDLLFVSPTYTFADALWGGQLTLGAAGAWGNNATSISGELMLVGPEGGVIMRSGTISDERFGFADLYPQALLRWNSGVHNTMTYAMGNLPVGTYDSSRLANFGIGHAAIDGGAGYTYFNPQTGKEFSAVTGLTYNFENEDTGYRNGVDWHLDMAASQFFSDRLHAGLVGYVYQQLTADEGAPEFLGDNKSSVIGLGPQVGYLFPVGGAQGYLNLKGFGEFGAENRVEGWNLWITFAISPKTR